MTCNSHPDYDENKAPENHCCSCWDVYDIAQKSKMHVDILKMCSQSQKNREELLKVWDQFREAGYVDMTVTLNASTILSQEQAEAELLHTLKSFLADKTKRPAEIVC